MSGYWYAFPDKTIVEQSIGNWHKKDEIWNLSTYPDDDDNDSETFFDEDESEVLAIDENGNPGQHMPALGLLEGFGARVDDGSQRANWGTVAWIYNVYVDDGDSAHLCLPWSEVCTTSTSLEWQYEAVYIYADVTYSDFPGDCGRIRVKAHEILTLVGNSLHVDSTAKGTCDGNGGRVKFRTRGILNRDPYEP